MNTSSASLASRVKVNDRLLTGGRLFPGEALTSPGRKAVAKLQVDGNFVIYEAATGQSVWATGTNGKPVTSAMLQDDGNFVLFDPQNGPVWATATNGAGGGLALVMQDDGNLVLYRGSSPVWDSGTYGFVTHKDRGWLGNIVSDVGDAVVQVTGEIKDNVLNPAFDAVGLGDALRWVEEHDPLGHILMAISRGSTPGEAIEEGYNIGKEAVSDVLPYAQMVLSFIPGIGQGLNAALSAGIALASGKPISDILIAAAAGALPGGELAKQAMLTGMNFVGPLVKGQSLSDAALAAARVNVPGGKAGLAAFDTGVAIATGQKLQKIASAVASGAPGGEGYLDSAAIDLGQKLLNGPLDTNAIKQGIAQLKSQGLAVLKDQATKLLPDLQKLGEDKVNEYLRPALQKMGSDPSLAMLTAQQLADKLQVPIEIARAANLATKPLPGGVRMVEPEVAAILLPPTPKAFKPAALSLALGILNGTPAATQQGAAILKNAQAGSLDAKKAQDELNRAARAVTRQKFIQEYKAMAAADAAKGAG